MAAGAFAIVYLCVFFVLMFTLIGVLWGILHKINTYLSNKIDAFLQPRIQRLKDKIVTKWRKKWNL